MTVQPKRSGELLLKVRSINGVSGELLINVPKPALDKLVFNQTPSRIYNGTVTKFLVRAIDKANIDRNDISVILSSSNPSIASFDSFGNLKAKKTGRVTISANAENITEKIKVRIMKNPVQSLTLNFEQEQIRTGDVLHLKANALNLSLIHI